MNSVMNLGHGLDPISVPPSPYRQPYPPQPQGLQRTYSNSSSTSSMTGRLQGPPGYGGRITSAQGGLGASGRSQGSQGQPLARRGRSLTEQQPASGVSAYRNQSSQGGYDDYSSSGRRQADGWGGSQGGYGRERGVGASGRGLRSAGYRVDEEL